MTNQINRKNFLTEVATLLEVKPSDLNDNFSLTQCGNWDSLTVVSVIGLLDTTFGVNVPIEYIEKVQTVQQLLELTEMKSGNTIEEVR